MADFSFPGLSGRQRWHANWERNGWRTYGKKPVKNDDLWRELIALVRERSVTFEHVKGHDGNYWNELADQRAVTAGRRTRHDPSVATRNDDD